MGYNWGLCAALNGAGGSRKNRAFSCRLGALFYCLDAVQRPVQPSDRTNEPEPVRPEKRPELFQLKPWTDPPVLVEPFGLTDPELSSPEILPPEMTNLSVLLPQGVPTATATHEPSKLPTAPPLPFHRRFSAMRGAARRIQVWRDVPAWMVQLRAAPRANRTAIFRRCRCCRRHCRIAPARRSPGRPKPKARRV